MEFETEIEFEKAFGLRFIAVFFENIQLPKRQ